jgi:hypothetical protein
MMGQQPRTEPLFYYFRLEDQIPDDHLLKRLDRCVDFRFVRERLRDAYSAMGRPSIDPEILLRLLLVGYLYGITSERRLLEEVRMHLAYRWFTRLCFDDISQEPARTFSVIGCLSGSILADCPARPGRGPGRGSTPGQGWKGIQTLTSSLSPISTISYIRTL